MIPLLDQCFLSDINSIAAKPNSMCCHCTGLVYVIAVPVLTQILPVKAAQLWMFLKVVNDLQHC